LKTGVLASLARGLLKPRARPSVTALRDTEDQDPSPALVAGGVDYTGAVLDTAEVYVPRTTDDGPGDFDRTAVVELSSGRTNHGAVVLRNGSTLLVGGSSATGLVPTMEAVDPKTRFSTTNGLTTLEHPRASPTVLRLADGQILVAGGIDEANEPVPWL